MFDWLANAVEQGGYLGIALLMLLENVFPPIPSELIMPLGGYLVFEGRLSLVGVAISGTLGSALGTSLWYLAARRLSRRHVYRLVDKYGRWLTVDRDGLDKATDRFRRHAASSVFVGRMLPAIRTLVSVPAGFACMAPVPFFLLTLAGTLVWNLILIGAGMALGSQYQKVSSVIDPITTGLLVLVAAVYLWRVWRGKGRRTRGSP